MGGVDTAAAGVNYFDDVKTVTGVDQAELAGLELEGFGRDGRRGLAVAGRQDIRVLAAIGFGSRIVGRLPGPGREVRPAPYLSHDGLGLSVGCRVKFSHDGLGQQLLLELAAEIGLRPTPEFVQHFPEDPVAVAEAVFAA